tara:strand:+ start:862 stop:2121 length:1260 start_codon:yes stop_codon:yes gene_type:complete
MKKFLLVYLFAISYITTTYAQTSFEKGYIIINNKKISCLIENEMWRYSPETVNYKFSESGKVITGNLNTIEGFGNNDKTFKYIKANVEVSQNSNDPDNLNYERRVVLEKKAVFLNTLVEGDISLYHYQFGDNNHFYYKKKYSANFDLLIYKKFLSSASQAKIIRENNRYKNQLANLLACDAISENKFSSLDYKKRDLIRIFEDYFKCKSDTYYIYKNEEEKSNLDYFKLTPKIGASVYNIDHEDSYRSVENISFDSKTSYSFGIEAELILPYNGGKWALFIESLYNNLENETLYEDLDHEYPGDYREFNIKNSYLQNSLGVRHRFFISNNSSIFLNGLFSFNTNLGSSSLEVYNYDDNEELYKYKLSNNSSFGIGGGFIYKEFRLEIRYNTNADFLQKEVNGTTLNYKKISFLLGYSIF